MARQRKKRWSVRVLLRTGIRSGEYWPNQDQQLVGGLAAGRTLISMWSQRSVIDYALARRATLASLFTGSATTTDVCDADPYLLRAAKFHGEPTDHNCPVCRREKLAHVTYVFGDDLGQYSGRIKATAELEAMAREHGEFRVYVVEVCQNCAWNHLTLSYVLGDGVPRTRTRRRRRSAEE